MRQNKNTESNEEILISSYDNRSSKSKNLNKILFDKNVNQDQRI